jgi:hypothetical protein
MAHKISFAITGMQVKKWADYSTKQHPDIYHEAQFIEELHSR